MQLVRGALELIDKLLLRVEDLLSAVLDIAHFLVELVESCLLAVQVSVQVIELLLKAPHLVHQLGSLVEVGVDLVLELVFLLSGRGHHLRKLAVHQHFVHFSLLAASVEIHQVLLTGHVGLLQVHDSVRVHLVKVGLLVECTHLGPVKWQH